MSDTWMSQAAPPVYCRGHGKTTATSGAAKA